jgi:hypothetical protein
MGTKTTYEKKKMKFVSTNQRRAFLDALNVPEQSKISIRNVIHFSALLVYDVHELLKNLFKINGA